MTRHHPRIFGTKSAAASSYQHKRQVQVTAQHGYGIMRAQGWLPIDQPLGAQRVSPDGMIRVFQRQHRTVAADRRLALETTMDTQALIELGFAQAGSCALDPSLKGGVRFALTQLRSDRVIYAFTVDGEAKYFGICDNTATCFSVRMGRYQGLMGKGTNKRIVGLIKAALDQARSVDIFAWKPIRQVTVAGLKVDLVKGLENPLIALASPEWNIRS